MRKDKALAFDLRRQNKSYNEISRRLGIPKSTLAGWFKYDKFSAKTKRLLTEIAKRKSVERIIKLNANNRLKWERWREEARCEARKEFSTLATNPLFITGLMLYWAEGDGKPKNPCRLTNTDPRMIKLYIKFLVKVLKIPIDSIRAGLILYPDLKENSCVRFWSNCTSLPKSQFYKTQFIKGRHPTTRLSNGICMIICGGRRVKEKLLVWIDLWSRKL